MKRSILERYARREDGTIIVDIAAGRIADLYNDWDRNTPFIKKDLAPDLVEYIDQSVSEIGKEHFVIQFSLSEPASEDMKSRLVKSVGNYFYYLREIEQQKLMGSLRKALILLFAGLMIIAASIGFNQVIIQDTSVFKQVFAEGLTIAGWVSVWEAMATILLDISPCRRAIRRCERIARAPLNFI